MSQSITINGTPIQYECEAYAGIGLEDGERVWGTHIRWRKGLVGAWKRFNVIDLHPFDYEGVARAVELYVGPRV